MTDAPAGTDAASPELATETETRHGVPVTWSCGQEVLHPGLDRYRSVIQALCEEGFEACMDVTAVDYLTHPGRTLPDGVEPERFEVVVNLLSRANRARVRVRVQVPEDEPVVPSLYELFPGTEVAEREVFDMYGIRFDGHPDLTRILMPEDWAGHPLRKDEPVGRIPVQFKGAPGPR